MSSDPIAARMEVRVSVRKCESPRRCRCARQQSSCDSAGDACGAAWRRTRREGPAGSGTMVPNSRDRDAPKSPGKAQKHWRSTPRPHPRQIRRAAPSRRAPTRSRLAAAVLPRHTRLRLRRHTGDTLDAGGPEAASDPTANTTRLPLRAGGSAVQLDWLRRAIGAPTRSTSGVQRSHQPRQSSGTHPSHVVDE
jgi:hypothetical protein